MKKLILLLVILAVQAKGQNPNNLPKLTDKIDLSTDYGNISGLTKSFNLGNIGMVLFDSTGYSQVNPKVYACKMLVSYPDGVVRVINGYVLPKFIGDYERRYEYFNEQKEKLDASLTVWNFITTSAYYKD